jgi:hypothetical protein
MRGFDPGSAAAGFFLPWLLVVPLVGGRLAGRRVTPASMRIVRTKEYERPVASAMVSIESPAL